MLVDAACNLYPTPWASWLGLTGSTGYISKTSGLSSMSGGPHDAAPVSTAWLSSSEGQTWWEYWAGVSSSSTCVRTGVWTPTGEKFISNNNWSDFSIPVCCEARRVSVSATVSPSIFRGGTGTQEAKAGGRKEA